MKKTDVLNRIIDLKNVIDENETAKEIGLYLLTSLIVFVSLLLKKPLLAIGMVIPIFLLSIISLNQNKDRIPRICINLLVFQNLVIGVFAHICGFADSDISYLSQIPFIFIFLAAVVVSVWKYQSKGRFNLRIEDYSFLILAFILIFQLVFSDGTMAAKIVGVRNYCTFYLVYKIGTNCLEEKKKLEGFFKFFVLICCFVVFVGFILYWMDFRGWEALGIREVYIAKKDNIVGNDFPGRFTTDFLGHQVKRMGSLYYEPVNLAYLLGAGLIVALFGPWTRNLFSRVVSSLFIGIGLLFTFGKGGILVAGIAIVGWLLYKILGTIGVREERRIKNILLLVLIPFIYYVGRYYVLHFNASTNPHIVAIISTWKSIMENPFGYGLGKGGNANLMFGAVEGDSFWQIYNAWLSTGGETALMAFVYQLGIQAFIFFFLCFHGMTTRISEGSGMGRFRYMVMLLPYILLGVSIYQENTYTPQCIVPFMLIIGGMASYKETYGKRITTGSIYN